VPDLLELVRQAADAPRRRVGGRELGMLLEREQLVEEAS
jgi:hypothetical protein